MASNILFGFCSEIGYSFCFDGTVVLFSIHAFFGLSFIVTTSLCQDWVINAPAAFLGCCSSDNSTSVVIVCG